MLRRTLNKRIGETQVPRSILGWLWTAALAATAAGWWLRVSIPEERPVIRAVVVLGTFSLVYLAVALYGGVAEARQLVRKMRRMTGS